MPVDAPNADTPPDDRFRLEGAESAPPQSFWDEVASKLDESAVGSGVVLDLSGAPHMSSLALGKIIRLHQQAARAGKTLTVVAPEYLKSMLAMTKLDRVLRVVDPADAGHPPPPAGGLPPGGAPAHPDSVPTDSSAADTGGSSMAHTPPTVEEAHSEWLRYHHTPVEVIDPDLSHAGQFVAFFDGRPRGYDPDPTALRERTAHALKVHPDRLVISYLG